MFAHAAPFADFQGHAARDIVARGQVFVMGRITFHEAFAIGVGEVSTLAARAFGDEAARAVDSGRVELYEFHVLQGQTRASHHAATVASAGMGACRAEIGAAIAAGGQNGHLGVEHMDRAIVQLPADDARAGPIGDDEIEREVFDEEFRVVLQALAVKRVQNGVAGAVGRRTGALHRRAFAVFGGVAAEGALVNLALFGAAERHAVMVQLINRLWRLPREVFHRVGVAQPVRTLDGVIHVPLPAVGTHIAQGRGDAALRCHRVRTRWENLGHTGGAQTLLGHAQRGAQASTASPHDDHVIVMHFIRIGFGHVLNLRARS